MGSFTEDDDGSLSRLDKDDRGKKTNCKSFGSEAGPRKTSTERATCMPLLAINEINKV